MGNLQVELEFADISQVERAGLQQHPGHGGRGGGGTFSRLHAHELLGVVGRGLHVEIKVGQSGEVAVAGVTAGLQVDVLVRVGRQVILIVLWLENTAGADVYRAPGVFPPPLVAPGDGSNTELVGRLADTGVIDQPPYQVEQSLGVISVGDLHQVTSSLLTNIPGIIVTFELSRVADHLAAGQGIPLAIDTGQPGVLREETVTTLHVSSDQPSPDLSESQKTRSPKC